ncbi:MAG: hypothetical protein UY48_C0002G0017 [Candidatus Gottesmanbacteria bacterium GW2011_GWB1_49_7]|uniref:Uncharacterized protein n=1 Tax=Candidatus Gottesmanbacteria bacterium GW2011_GWB1_49_7 TaxID=1618448 RepID=A0A0G1W3I4_9BACT|nr:MAG: hypothetical protein UY48_C0002G0017 [Candidatus Gottesmanbacteria bacterium GW2011_GWB1_49_7]
MNRPYRVRVATFAAFASPEVWLTGLEEWKAYVQAYRLVRRILAHRRKAGRGCDYTYEGPGGGAGEPGRDTIGKSSIVLAIGIVKFM